MDRREIRSWLMDMDGVLTREERHPYRPSRIVESVAELIDELS
jgi:hypothetical protein